MRILLTVLSLLAITISGAIAKDVQVKDYTKKDGTHVAGYTRHEKDPDTVKVKGYTKKDGTKVAGYTRKKATEPAASDTTTYTPKPVTGRIMSH